MAKESKSETNKQEAMGVKGNDGKAAKSKALQQFAIICAMAFALVFGVKLFGTAPWHSKAVPHDGQAAAIDKRGDILTKSGEEDSSKSEGKEAVTLLKGGNKESNFIQFEFSNLGGEEGNTGIVVVELIPEWAPIGVQRVKELTAASFWEGCRFFRVLPNFIAQIGINGDPDVAKQWRSRRIEDDPVVQSNDRGTVTFAMAGKGSRTTQLFFNFKSNAYLDKEGFAPFGKVISGMDVVDKIYDGYKEKPNQGLIQSKGNEYLEHEFPKLSYVSRATFINPS